MIMLSRRRLFQLSIYDLLLLTTAVTAMLVGYGAQAPRALVYTVGFVGGLLGTAIALNRREPRLWEAIILGAAFGVAGGYLAAFGIEALHRGIPYESAWKWHFKKGRRVPATNYAPMYGLIGGVAASGLSTSLCVFKSWVSQQRMRETVDDDQSSLS
jgi:hypothetical protein